MILKRGLNWRLHPENSIITFYNGQDNELSSNNIESLWELLTILSSEECIEEKLKKWKNDYDYTEEDFNSIINFLVDNGLVYEKTPINSEAINKRNFNYFSIYDSSIYADRILKKISSSSAMIFGVGTIGSTLALSLANLGVKKIILVDYDTVEEKNIPAQFIFERKDIGKKKSLVVKSRIERNYKDIKVVALDLGIHNSQDVEYLLKKYNVDVVYNCFDTATEKLHNDIIDITMKKGVQYILMGYVYDSVIAFDMNTQGKNIIKNSFKDFKDSNIISENRGTILQSMGSTLIGINLFLSELLKDFGYGEKVNHLSFNIKDMSIDKDGNKDNFIKSLEEIYPTDTEMLYNYINKIIKEYKNGIEKRTKTLENELLSLNQFFELLIDIDKINDYEKAYHVFTNFLEEVDDSSYEDKSEGSKHNNYIRYQEIIDSIRFEETKNVYHMTNTYKDNNTYDMRLNKQKEIFEAIKEKAPLLIEILEHEKSTQRKVYSIEIIEEILGANIHTLETFSSEVKNNFNFLFKRLYSKFYDTDGINFDYLQSNIYENPKIGDFKYTFQLIEDTLRKHESMYQFRNHISRILKDNHIKLIESTEQNNVNKTVFFPKVQQNRIVITYDESYNSFFTLIHELGHSYYNLFYNHQSYFDHSNRILNETLALFTEFITVFSFRDYEQFEVLSTHFIERMSKILLSNFAIYSLEEKLINYLENNNDKVSLDNFLELQEELDQELFGDIELKNSKYNQLNILLYPYFIFNYKDYLVDSIAVLISAYLFQHYRELPEKREHLLREFFMTNEVNIESFCKYMFDEHLNLNLIRKMIKNFISLCDELDPKEQYIGIV
jgi:ThiF family